MNMSKVENLPSLSDKFFMKYTYIYFLKSILMQFGRFSVYYFVRPFDLTVGSLSVCSSWEHSTSEISGHASCYDFEGTKPNKHGQVSANVGSPICSEQGAKGIEVASMSANKTLVR